MLAGWISSGAYGARFTRPDSTSFLISRSESSTLATYRFLYHVGTGSALAVRTAGQPPLPPAGVVQWQNVSFPS